MQNLDNPLKTSDVNLVDSKPGQFVRFTYSDWQKDGAQTVIPLMDAEERTIKPSVAFGGLGLYHKAVKGYGGYIALKMISLNYAHLMAEGRLDGQADESDPTFDELRVKPSPKKRKQLKLS